jgi:hypothetical protein
MPTKLYGFGEENPNWKGGRKVKKYIQVLKPDHHQCDRDGYVMEQRLVFEEHHKCCLLPWIVIWHKNQSPKDNRIENLEPITISRRGYLVRKGKPRTGGHPPIPSDRNCCICNSYKTWAKNGNPIWYRYPPRSYDDTGLFTCGTCYNRVRYS